MRENTTCLYVNHPLSAAVGVSKILSTRVLQFMQLHFLPQVHYYDRIITAYVQCFLLERNVCSGNVVILIPFDMSKIYYYYPTSVSNEKIFEIRNTRLFRKNEMHGSFSSQVSFECCFSSSQSLFTS